MNVLRVIFILFFFQNMANAGSGAACEKWPYWARPICLRPYQTWTQGKNELYISGYAWHNRYYYDRDRLHRYNEHAWGVVLVKVLMMKMEIGMVFLQSIFWIHINTLSRPLDMRF